MNSYTSEDLKRELRVSCFAEKANKPVLKPFVLKEVKQDLVDASTSGSSIAHTMKDMTPHEHLQHSFKNNKKTASHTDQQKQQSQQSSSSCNNSETITNAGLQMVGIRVKNRGWG